MRWYGVDDAKGLLAWEHATWRRERVAFAESERDYFTTTTSRAACALAIPECESGCSRAGHWETTSLIGLIHCA